MKRAFSHFFCQTEDVPPYTGLAYIYDHTMNHVNYSEWANYIETLFFTFGENVHRIIDGGCGTGSLTRILKEKGYFIAGFDRSFEMILAARRKTGVPFWQGDLRSISFSSGWDGFLCLYDTIQYLLIDEIAQLFADLASVLSDGGLFIFDMVTEMHIKRYWAYYTELDRDSGWESLRRSWYDIKNRCQHTEFELFSKTKSKRFREHHVQNIYSLSEIEQIAASGHLSLQGCFDGFTLEKGNEDSDRVHLVFKKAVM